MTTEFNRHGFLLGLAGKKREPWYDSTPVCLGGILVLLLFFAFGITGIVVASGNPGYLGLVWIPGLVCLLAAVALVSVIARLFARRFSGSNKGF
ncbi:MAG: hypothetical protein QMD09_08650 [Desulfatibacillaceae bacterium]|nr:hypothetical protein [Desulfatibacillaceae bacterium]